MSKPVFTYRGLSDAEKIDILNQYEKLCYKLANYYYRKNPKLYEVDDYFQIARIGLLRAINLYQGDKGSKFITYATASIKRVIVREMNVAANKKYVDHVVLSSDLKVNTGEYVKNQSAASVVGEDTILSTVSNRQKQKNEYSDNNAQEQELVDNVFINGIIDYVMTSKLFGEPERTVFRNRIMPILIGEPIVYTQSDLSHLMDVSQEYVCLLEKRVRTALQVYVGKAGITVEDGKLTVL